MNAFYNKKAFKVISGITNFDPRKVENVVRAANEGGATFVDIACDPNLVQLAKSVGKNVGVCVSSIQPEKFIPAVQAGADLLEIGNYDEFYDKGIRFTAEDVLQLTKKTKQLLPHSLLSVTIPHTLNLEEQAKLGKQLEDIGVDIIQTEGKVSADLAQTTGIETLIEKAASSIAAAYVLSRATRIPILCSSGLSHVTAPMAISAGASGVGVGSMINKLSSLNEMLDAVNLISAGMGWKEVRAPAPFENSFKSSSVQIFEN